MIEQIIERTNKHERTNGVNMKSKITNAIAVIEGRRIKKYSLGPSVLSMTVIRKHLIRTDARLFHKDVSGGEAILFTELESTQVYGAKDNYTDPDITIAMLDTAPTSTNRAVGHLGILIENPMVVVYVAVAAIVLLSGLGLV